MKAVTEFSGRYGFLSNGFPVSVRILIGTTWMKCPSVEHAFQASKTLDQHWRQRIATAPTGADARRLGNQRGIHRVSYWDDVRTIVMLELLRQKFSRSVLRNRLLNTNNLELINGNRWHDNFWGRCICERCFMTCVDAHGRSIAADWLGRLLMRVRHDLRHGIQHHHRGRRDSLS